MKRISAFIFAGIFLIGIFYLVNQRSFSRTEGPETNAARENNVAVLPPSTAYIRDITGQSKIDQLRLAVQSGDQREIAIAFERLAHHTEEFPESFGGLLAALKTETEPEVLNALVRLISEESSCHQKKLVSATALEMSQSADPAKRRLAVSLFSSAPEMEPSSKGALLKLQRDADVSVRFAANAALKQRNTELQTQ